jgi:predicted ABC-type ATPase
MAINLLKRIKVVSHLNGAGKTTFAREFLANYAHCPNFVNANIIADRLFTAGARERCDCLG